MNDEIYQRLKAELTELESIDWENDDEANESAEQIQHRMTCLYADIFGYEHPDVGYNPYEALL